MVYKARTAGTLSYQEIDVDFQGHCGFQAMSNVP